MISETQLQQDTHATLQRVVEERAPVMVTLDSTHQVIMMALDDFLSYDETSFLMRGRNGEKLLEALQNIKDGKVVTKTMADLNALDEA